jgi:hypothetical protein
MTQNGHSAQELCSLAKASQRLIDRTLMLTSDADPRTNILFRSESGPTPPDPSWRLLIGDSIHIARWRLPVLSDKLAQLAPSSVLACLGGIRIFFTL